MYNIYGTSSYWYRVELKSFTITKQNLFVYELNDLQ